MTAKLSALSPLPAITPKPLIAAAEQGSTDPVGAMFAAVLATMPAAPGTPLPVSGKVMPTGGTTPPDQLADNGLTGEIAPKAADSAIVAGTALTKTVAAQPAKGKAMAGAGAPRPDHAADDDERASETTANGALDTTVTNAPPANSITPATVAILPTSALQPPPVRPIATDQTPSSRTAPALAASPKLAAATSAAAPEPQAPRTEALTLAGRYGPSRAPGERPASITPVTASGTGDLAGPATVDRRAAVGTAPAAAPFETLAAPTMTPAGTSAVARALETDAAVTIALPSPTGSNAVPDAVISANPELRSGAPASLGDAPRPGIANRTSVTDNATGTNAPMASTTRKPETSQPSTAPASQAKTSTVAPQTPSAAPPIPVAARVEAALDQPKPALTPPASQPAMSVAVPVALPAKPATRAASPESSSQSDRGSPVLQGVHTMAQAAFAHDLQPTMSAHDAGATQQAPTPSPAAAQAQSAPTDLGTLVDRLIAARQASQTSQVTAHVAHADFGRIDLSFATDAAGLTVGMRSHDPDFAPSVQAAASIAPPQAVSDPRGTQDLPQQQSAATSSGGSQGFARDQGRAGSGQTGREPAHSGGSDARTPRGSASDRPEDPRGVYA